MPVLMGNDASIPSLFLMVGLPTGTGLSNLSAATPSANATTNAVSLNASDWPQQLAQFAQPLLKLGQGIVHITVNPPHLGPIQVQVGQGAQGLTVFLQAAAASTQVLLQQSIPALTAAFTSQGLGAPSVDVPLGFTGDPGSFGGQPSDKGLSPRNGGGSATSVSSLQGGDVKTVPGAAASTRLDVWI
ncbi:flagellar hook-length control protein FliK [Acidithiobacillus ferrivorans]|nr:flagellar hook-length control protein FliK [Acidithiobacillus ferrivorans]